MAKWRLASRLLLHGFLYLRLLFPEEQDGLHQVLFPEFQGLKTAHEAEVQEVFDIRKAHVLFGRPPSEVAGDIVLVRIPGSIIMTPDRIQDQTLMLLDLLAYLLDVHRFPHQKKVEAPLGVEPSPSGSRPEMLPLHHGAMVDPAGVEPASPGCKPGVFPGWTMDPTWRVLSRAGGFGPGVWPLPRTSPA